MRTFRKASFNIVFAVTVAALLVGGWVLSRPSVSSVAKSGKTPASASRTSPASDVELVRAATLSESPTRTVGTAFESTFQQPTWKSMTTPNGEVIVEFRGTVGYTAFSEAGFYIGTWNGVPQGVEFAQATAVQKQSCSALAPSATDDSAIAGCMAKVYQTTVIPVSFQFTLSADRKRTELTMVDAVFQKFDPDHRLRSYRTATLAFIYK